MTGHAVSVDDHHVLLVCSKNILVHLDIRVISTKAVGACISFVHDACVEPDPGGSHPVVEIITDTLARLLIIGFKAILNNDRSFKNLFGTSKATVQHGLRDPHALVCAVWFWDIP